MNTPEVSLVTVSFPLSDGKVERRMSLNLKEASELTGVPVSQWRKLCRDGTINPLTGFGKKWRITAEDLLKIMSKRLRKTGVLD